MHPQDERGPFRNCGLVIGQPGPIRCADLPQNRARFPQNVRDAKPAADFYKFSARNDNFAAIGKRVQDQKGCGRTIIDD
jgi:hypothetical protein